MERARSYLSRQFQPQCQLFPRRPLKAVRTPEANRGISHSPAATMVDLGLKLSLVQGSCSLIEESPILDSVLNGCVRPGNCLRSVC